MDVNYVSEDSESSWPERPFLTILYQPKSTIRAIVDSNPKKFLLLLASLSGIAQMLNWASRDIAMSFTSGYEIIGALIVILVGGNVLGLTQCYIGSFFFRKASNLLGGVSTNESVRAAIVWSSVPTISLLFFWMVKIAIYDVDVFNENAAVVTNFPILYAAFSLIEVIFGLWTLFLFWKCLGEVNRFSAWKSILVEILVLIFFYLLYGVIQLAYSI